jgi:hypothetical protein
LLAVFQALAALVWAVAFHVTLAAKAFAPAAATATAKKPAATFRANTKLSFMRNPFLGEKTRKTDLFHQIINRSLP